MNTVSEKTNSAISQNKSSTSGKSLANLGSKLELLTVYQEVIWQGRLKESRVSTHTSNLPEDTQTCKTNRLITKTVRKPYKLL